MCCYNIIIMVEHIHMEVCNEKPTNQPILGMRQTNTNRSMQENVLNYFFYIYGIANNLHIYVPGQSVCQNILVPVCEKMYNMLCNNRLLSLRVCHKSMSV